MAAYIGFAALEEMQVDEIAKETAGRGRPSRPRVMPDLTRAIASDIVAGRYAAGSTLPTENELGVRYGVSRTVIREALKVLAAKGLVLSRPRIGTVVCEQDNWNIIDPQVLSWHDPHALDEKLFDAILETRRAIEPLVTEIAAERATLREVADLEAAWKGMADAGADLAAFTSSDILFHRILYAACHNPVFRQIGGMIDTALRFALEASAAHSLDRRTEAVVAHREVVEALRMRDRDAARKAANHILDLAARDLVNAKKHSKN